MADNQFNFYQKNDANSHEECSLCNGNKLCDKCDGKGYNYNNLSTSAMAVITGGLSLVLGRHKNDCKPCNGTGKCYRCGGRGYE